LKKLNELIQKSQNIFKGIIRIKGYPLYL